MTSLATHPNCLINDKLQHDFHSFVCLWCSQTHWNTHKKLLMRIIGIESNCKGVRKLVSLTGVCWVFNAGACWVLCRGQNESSALSSPSCTEPPRGVCSLSQQMWKASAFFFSLSLSPPQLLKGRSGFLLLLLFQCKAVGGEKKKRESTKKLDCACFCHRCETHGIFCLSVL